MQCRWKGRHEGGNTRRYHINWVTSCSDSITALAWMTESRIENNSRRYTADVTAGRTEGMGDGSCTNSLPDAYTSYRSYNQPNTHSPQTILCSNIPARKVRCAPSWGGNCTKGMIAEHPMPPGLFPFPPLARLPASLRGSNNWATPPSG